MSTANIDLVLVHLLLLVLSDDRLNEGGFVVYVDSVATLQVFNVIVEESFVIS